MRNNCENIEMTSRETNQDVKDWKTGNKWFFQKDNGIKHTAILVYKLKSFWKS